MTNRYESETTVPIYRHASERTPEFASYESRYLEDIGSHIAAHLQAPECVLHELVSLTVHVDVHVVKPTEKVPFITLVTSGMSDLSMTVPDQIESKAEHELAELIAFLPPDWPIKDLTGPFEGDADPPGYYPVYWLKFYARMAHDNSTWLTWGHTSANGEPASAIAPSTEMRGFLFTPPFPLPEEAWMISLKDGRTLRLLNVVPIFSDEIVFAINKGGIALIDKFLAKGSELAFNPNRASCLKRNKLFGLF